MNEHYPSNELSKVILSSNRLTVREYMAMITGHCALNKFEFTCKRSNSPLCTKCNEEEETAYHPPSECPALERRRFLTFGHSTFSRDLIPKLKIYTCLNFSLR